MPIKVSDLDGGLGNLFVAWGRLTEQEYVEVLMRRLTQDEDRFRRYRYSLSDYSAVAGVELPTSAIEQMLPLCRTAASVNPDALVAIVADRDVAYGLSRMWEILMTETGWEIAVFRSRDEAEEWIRREAETRFGIDDLAMEPT
jgi:hypothetical protein